MTKQGDQYSKLVDSSTTSNDLSGKSTNPIVLDTGSTKVFGIIIVAILLVLLLWAVLALSSGYGLTVGQLSVAEGSHIGDTVHMEYVGGETDIKFGQPIEWYVDDTLAGKEIYTGQPIELDYTSHSFGTHRVRVKLGRKYSNVSRFVVDKAILTVTADDIIVRSGDRLPAFTYSYSGLISGDTFPQLDVTITAEYVSNGSYRLAITGQQSVGNYQAEYVSGTLTVVS